MITPLGKKIQLKIEQPTAGGLDLSAKETAIEVGEIIGLAGERSVNLQNLWIGKTELKIGDKIFFKAWALDIITYEGEKYYFIDSDSNAICAIIK